MALSIDEVSGLKEERRRGRTSCWSKRLLLLGEKRLNLQHTPEHQLACMLLL